MFHPENICMGSDIYVGHYAILKGYHRNTMSIGNGCWIGQHALLHAAGGLRLEAMVGIGPAVQVLTSQHERTRQCALVDAPLEFAEVVIEQGADIGAGAIILPGVTVGRGTQVAAGAVVTHSLPPYCVAAGTPARPIKHIPS